MSKSKLVVTDKLDIEDKKREMARIWKELQTKAGKRSNNILAKVVTQGHEVSDNTFRLYLNRGSYKNPATVNFYYEILCSFEEAYKTEEEVKSAITEFLGAPSDFIAFTDFIKKSGLPKYVFVAKLLDRYPEYFHGGGSCGKKLYVNPKLAQTKEFQSLLADYRNGANDIWRELKEVRDRVRKHFRTTRELSEALAKLLGKKCNSVYSTLYYRSEKTRNFSTRTIKASRLYLEGLKKLEKKLSEKENKDKK